MPAVRNRRLGKGLCQEQNLLFLVPSLMDREGIVWRLLVNIRESYALLLAACYYVPYRPAGRAKSYQF
jgi:hypothetical protein